MWRKIGRAVVAVGFTVVLALSLPARVALAEEEPETRIGIQSVSLGSLSQQIATLQSTVVAMNNGLSTAIGAVWTGTTIRRSDGTVTVLQDLANTGTQVRTANSQLTTVRSNQTAAATAAAAAETAIQNSVSGVQGSVESVQLSVSNIPHVGWNQVYINRNGRQVSMRSDVAGTGTAARNAADTASGNASKLQALDTLLGGTRVDVSNFRTATTNWQNSANTQLATISDGIDALDLAVGEMTTGGMTPEQASSMIDGINGIADSLRQSADECVERNGTPWWASLTMTGQEWTTDPCDTVEAAQKWAEQSRRLFDQDMENKRQQREDALEQARRDYEEARAQAHEQARRQYEEAQETARRNYESAQREAVAQGFREQLQGLREATEQVGELIEGTVSEVTEAVELLGDDLERLFEQYFGDGDGDDGEESETPGPGEGVSGLPGLDEWMGVVACEIEPLEGSICEGPTIDLGFMVWEILPCDQWADLKPHFDTFKSIIAALILAASGAFAARWLLAAFNLNAPNSQGGL